MRRFKPSTFVIAILLLAMTLSGCGGKNETPPPLDETLSASSPVATEAPVAPAVQSSEPVIEQEKITTCPSKIQTNETTPVRYVRVVSNGYIVFHNASLNVYTVSLASPYEEKATNFGLLNVGDSVEVFCSLDVFSYAAQIKAADPDSVVFIGSREVTPMYDEQITDLIVWWYGASNGVGIGTEVSGVLLYWSFADQQTFTFIVKNGQIAIPDSMAIVQDPNFPGDNTRKVISTLDGNWYYFFFQFNADGSVNILHRFGVFLFLSQ